MPIQNVYAEATQNVYRRLPIVRGEKEKHRIWFLSGYTECSQLAVLDFFPGGGSQSSVGPQAPLSVAPPPRNIESSGSC